MDTISRAELLDLLDQPRPALVFVEALPVDQYEAEHLPGAVNLPGDLNAATAAQLVPDKDALIITYCSGQLCRRSKNAAAGFIRLGYSNVRVYGGGKTDWADAGLPFEGTRAAASAGAGS